jgi:hypothetical protein
MNPHIRRSVLSDIFIAHSPGAWSVKLGSKEIVKDDGTFVAAFAEEHAARLVCHAMDLVRDVSSGGMENAEENARIVEALSKEYPALLQRLRSGS